MNSQTPLKTLLPRIARGGLLLAALAGLFSGAATAHAAKDGAPAYYAAYEIPAPNGFTGQDRAVVLAMNDQGYALVVNGFYSSNTLYVYLKDHYITLGTGGLNLASGNGSLSATNLSNVAADGSFNVVGEGSFADGFHRVVFWHVNADGTSTTQMMKNRVLGEDSTNPGEQASASAYAVNAAGTIAGSVQSYLAGLGAFWYPPNTTPSSPFEVYEGPSDLDEAGNWCGQNGSNALFNGSPLLPEGITYPRTYRLKNGRIAGSFYNSNVSNFFVYDLATSTYALLPTYDTAADASNQQVKFLDDAGDAIGQSSSSKTRAYLNDATLWKRDPNTGTYTAYNLQSDIVGPVYTDSYLTLERYRAGVGAFLADGTIAVNGVTDLYNGNQDAIVVFKLGLDPRPKINVPVGSAYSNELILSTKPNQAFRYQFTATNNPTAFRLLDTSDKTKDATLPAGLSFDSRTGVLSGTPTTIENFYFLAQATNGQGVGVLTTFSILTVGSAPMITSASTATGHLNQPFTFQVTATNSPTGFQFNGLPDGLTYASNTGLISGTPTKAGTFAVAETVDNAVSGGFSGTPSGTGTLTITIDDKPPAAFRVSLIKPVDNLSVIAGTALTAKAKVDLTNAGTETVASISFQLDGQPVGPTLTAKPYKGIVPLDGSLSGTHLLTAVATANDGRAAVSTPVTINVAARFVDLAGSATLKGKVGPDGKVTVKGQYTLSNSGNTAAGPFRIGFYLSNDAAFDATDVSVNALATPILGRDPGFDLAIPGLPANTTLDSTDLSTLLPKLKIAFPPTLAPLLTRYSGKYLLAVVDPENTADEDADTRANNVIVYRLP